MEYYLKKDDPVNDKWLEDNLGWLKEEEKNKILNLSEIKRIDTNYSDFEQIIYLPNNPDSIITNTNNKLNNILNKFLEECNDDLTYFISTNIDIKNMIINIFLLPIVESA